ncbi:hypothetical protein V5799_015032 [Amblyomma americanum]|uniref:Endonuclease/exonuclease/phosphatase domain-containing protein n=1 Tax=Amblyomma americanum TaxID=6943 RepID=A0AAQ4E1B3_AMBAM
MTLLSSPVQNAQPQQRSLRDVVREDYSAFLYSLPGVLEVRINRRRYIIAADVASEESLAGLMGLRTLLNTPVRPFEASRPDGCLGTIFGVDPAVSDREITDTIEASVDIQNIRRRGDAVTIRSSAAPPEQVLIAGMPFRETRVPVDAARLPGYTGYAGCSSCALQTCRATPSLDSSHPQEKPRAAIYVRSNLPHTVLDVASPDMSPMEASAIRVRLGGKDTSVASVYVPPSVPWDPSCLTALYSRLGKDALICGDFNAHHRDWGSQTTTSRDRKLLDAVAAAGLHLLRPKAATFIRPRHSTVIDLALHSEACRYSWKRAADSLGSDHFSIHLSPAQQQRPKDREYRLFKWPQFRELTKEIQFAGDFLDCLKSCAQVATMSVSCHA